MRCFEFGLLAWQQSNIRYCFRLQGEIENQYLFFFIINLIPREGKKKKKLQGLDFILSLALFVLNERNSTFSFMSQSLFKIRTRECKILPSNHRKHSKVLLDSTVVLREKETKEIRGNIVKVKRDIEVALHIQSETSREQWEAKDGIMVIVCALLPNPYLFSLHFFFLFFWCRTIYPIHFSISFPIY